MTTERQPVHVVLVNLNRADDTIECLESVLRSDYPDVRAIVVDNGSSDDSVQKLTRWANGQYVYKAPDGPLQSLSWPPVPKPAAHQIVDARGGAAPSRETPLCIVTLARNTGFAAGNNTALHLILDVTSGRESRGYALLLNNDMVVAPDAISRLVQALDARTDVAAMGGVTLDYADVDRVQMVGGAARTGFGREDVLGAGLHRNAVPVDAEIAFVGGGCLLIRLDMLRTVGLFDEAFFLYGEDYDWGVRMRQKGYRLAYAPDSYVWHKGSVTVVLRSPFQDYHMIRGTLTFVKKHLPHLMPLALLHSFVRSLAPKIVRRQWKRARAVLRAYLDHFRSIPAGPDAP
jgi:GT2 family glycosyltransferase